MQHGAVLRFSFGVRPPSVSRFSNSCISAKYCPILTIHQWNAYLFIFQVMYKSQLRKKLTLMTGFVVHGHKCSGGRLYDRVCKKIKKLKLHFKVLFNKNPDLGCWILCMTASLLTPQFNPTYPGKHKQVVRKININATLNKRPRNPQKKCTKLNISGPELQLSSNSWQMWMW